MFSLTDYLSELNYVPSRNENPTLYEKIWKECNLIGYYTPTINLNNHYYCSSYDTKFHGQKVKLLLKSEIMYGGFFVDYPIGEIWKVKTPYMSCKNKWFGYNSEPMLYFNLNVIKFR